MAPTKKGKKKAVKSIVRSKSKSPKKSSMSKSPKKSSMSKTVTVEAYKTSKPSKSLNMLLLFLGMLALAGAGVGIYFLLKPGADETKPPSDMPSDMPGNVDPTKGEESPPATGSPSAEPTPGKESNTAMTILYVILATLAVVYLAGVAFAFSQGKGASSLLSWISLTMGGSSLGEPEQREKESRLKGLKRKTASALGTVKSKIPRIKRNRNKEKIMDSYDEINEDEYKETESEKK
jgi:flagellar basal body-associated protein FliL